MTNKNIMKGDFKMDYDFSGWATRNNIQCSDGRTIMKDAFKQNDGQKVPLVWNHQHDDPAEVLGHAVLENREDGVYAYCKFNDTESGQTAKSLVKNGDVDKLSIYANKLKSKMNNVVHGCIREVSLVLAGANPGAYIDSVVIHGEDADAEEEAIIYTEENISLFNEDETSIEHSDDNDGSEEKLNKEDEKKVDQEEKKTENNEETVADVFETLSDKQKDAVYAMIGQALEDAGVSDDEEDEEGEEENMKHNVFDNDENQEVLMHSEILSSAIQDAKRYGSLRESVIEHAAINNITDIDKLFPDATELYKEPRMIEKDQSWVAKVMNKTKHTPFSRVKTTFGKMTEPQARAKGYIKGNKKVNIQMAVLNRVTTPTTVYIKNDIDRDDVVDITDFDVVAWQKKEMRKELDKELALAMLLGDGRDVSDSNKINEQNIRPIVKDDDLFTIKYTITSGRDYNQTGNSHSDNDSFTKGIIRAALRARKEYKGSGRPTMFTTEDYLTDMLLIEDQNGRIIYDSVDKLATALRVDEIVTIPEMEQEEYADIVAIIVNMADYTAGADKGGSINMFDDFDIDYNQMKYLMETRMSGALTVPYSAIVLKKATNNQSNEPAG
jgi:HK97 family phage prohead protease